MLKRTFPQRESPTVVMTDDTLLQFDHPAVSCKKVTAGFAGRCSRRVVI